MTVDPIIAQDAQFQKDNAKMLADAAKVQADIMQTKQDAADFFQKLKNPALNANYALILMFYYMGASSETSTLLGFFTDKGGITGDQLALNGDLTTVGNDLNNMTQNNSSDPHDMVVFGGDANTVLNELNDVGGKYPDLSQDPTKTPSGQTSMDPSAENAVYQNLLQIRQEFNLHDGSGYDPTGTNYYFDPTNSTYIQSFAEMQTDLGGQGDTKQATEAAKMMTDDFSTNTQTTQTSSAVLNNDQKNYTAVQQSIQSMLSGIAQWWNTLVKNANSHTLTS